MARRKPVQDPRAASVLSARRAGIPWDVLMAELRIETREKAETLFEQALAAAKVRYDTDLELERLDRLHVAVWGKASEGDLSAISTVLRIAEMRKSLNAKPTDNDHSVRNAFDRSVAASAHVDVEVDAGAIETGRMIADRIDEAVASGEGQEVTKALYLSPHLMNVLKALLATPEARMQKALLEAKEREETDDERELADLQQVVGSKVTPIRKGRKP